MTDTEHIESLCCKKNGVPAWGERLGNDFEGDKNMF